MNKVKLHQEAMRNFSDLRENPYPGRGIVVGLDDEESTSLVQVYWIMGRSENSRNRIFVEGERGLVATEAADPAKVKDPSLIIYNAMVEGMCDREPFVVVSNGKQTGDVAERIQRMLFCQSLSGYEYEPDVPNFTPRITAVSYWQNSLPKAKMSILRKSPWTEACDRHQYEYDALGAGFGHCITTYSGDGDPLPSFRGEPLLMPLLGNIEDIAFGYWEALDPDNRVSLAVKFIPTSGESKTFIINKYTRVPETAQTTE